MPESEVNSPEGMVWYLPHTFVLYPYKLGKIRVVFDWAVAYSNFVLKKHLFRGPSLIPSLAGILFRTRQFRVAISADIEAFYHRVGVLCLSCRSTIRTLRIWLTRTNSHRTIHNALLWRQARLHVCCLDTAICHRTEHGIPGRSSIDRRRLLCRQYLQVLRNGKRGHRILTQFHCLSGKERL